MKTFKISDSLLIEHAGTVKQLLNEDLSEFTAFDATLNAEKVEKLGLCIKEVKSMDPDRVIMSGIAEKTVTVKELIEAAKTYIKQAFYFAEKKFKAKPVILDEFGLKTFRMAQRSQPKLVLYMFQLEKTIKKYRNELLDAGAQPTLLDNIGIVANMLNSGNLDQEVLKKMRPMLTLERNAKLADVYAILQEFNRASKKVYAKNPLKRSRYNMPRNTRKSGGKGESEKQ